MEDKSCQEGMSAENIIYLFTMTRPDNIVKAECRISDRQSKESCPTDTALGNNNISRNKNCVNIFCIVGQNLKAFKLIFYIQ